MGRVLNIWFWFDSHLLYVIGFCELFLFQSYSYIRVPVDLCLPKVFVRTRNVCFVDAVSKRLYLLFLQSFVLKIGFLHCCLFEVVDHASRVSSHLEKPLNFFFYLFILFCLGVVAKEMFVCFTWNILQFSCFIFLFRWRFLVLCCFEKRWFEPWVNTLLNSTIHWSHFQWGARITNSLFWDNPWSTFYIRGLLFRGCPILIKILFDLRKQHRLLFRAPAFLCF